MDIYVYLSIAITIIILYILYNKQYTLQEGKKSKVPSSCRRKGKRWTKSCVKKVCKTRKYKSLCNKIGRCRMLPKGRGRRYIIKGNRRGNDTKGKCVTIKRGKEWKKVKKNGANTYKMVTKSSGSRGSRGVGGLRSFAGEEAGGDSRVVKCKTDTIPKNWRSAYTFTPGKWEIKRYYGCQNKYEQNKTSMICN